MHKQLGRSHQAAASADLPSAFTEPYTVLRLVGGRGYMCALCIYTHTRDDERWSRFRCVANTRHTKAKQKKSNRNQFSNRTAYREELRCSVCVCVCVWYNNQNDGAFLFVGGRFFFFLLPSERIIIQLWFLDFLATILDRWCKFCFFVGCVLDCFVVAQRERGTDASDGRE